MAAEIVPATKDVPSDMDGSKSDASTHLEDTKAAVSVPVTRSLRSSTHLAIGHYGTRTSRS